MQLKIKKNEKTIKSLEKKQNKTSKQAQKLYPLKRHLPRWTQKLSALEHDKANKIARICFGSKRLFKRQFNLNANNIKNHAQWQKKWKAARNPDWLVGKHGKYIYVHDVHFAYAHDEIWEAIAQNNKRNIFMKNKSYE